MLLKDTAGRTIALNWRGPRSGCGGGGGAKLARLVDANGNETRWEYDAQGRLTKAVRANETGCQYTYELSTSHLKQVKDTNQNVKTYTYDGATGRPTSLTYPNGQQTNYAYYDNLGDHRLQEIHNKRPGGATLSKFDYTYDPAGNISTWRQQADNDPAKVYEFGYDKTDQLTAAILKSTDPTPTILKRQFWSYDAAGNRTAEQTDDAVTGAAYNNMNQLLSQAAGGALVFKGTVNEPFCKNLAGLRKKFTR